MEEGGLLVLTNSARRFWLGSMILDVNEDWSDANALSDHFGVVFEEGTLSASSVQTGGSTP